ncbi:hypothetical protein HAX54_053531 [Datura stramonium]|uniref:Endonuclease/exonuclease/phosphatase domain-containing protein n=1 Tax=Datura stramonium TaxID=4076 RepID=A0ABS8T1K1_DATST|nr:hypothetical protein [Datura stramonium]
MKHSAPSLQLLAAAAFTDAATASAAMSSATPFRGGRGRGRRNFSHRPSGERSEQDIVTGDSHFNSVSETNRNLRPSPNFRPFRPRAPTPNIHPNQHIYGQLPSPQPRQPFHHNQQSYGAVPPPVGLYQNQQFNRAVPPQPLRPQYYWNQQLNRPNFYENQQFNRPIFYENQQFNRPNFYENQQFRPRPSPPKALNFRNWEYARPGPPPHCERFTVLSYNILADYLAIDHQRKLYFHIPQHILDWEWRKRSILSELGWWSADILCFQEVDRFQELEAELKLRGYSGIWKRRTGDPADGCAIFWLASRFKLVHEEFIEFKKFGLRDNVAQICVFESLGQQNKSSPAPSASPGHSNKVVICNTHVLFNPRRGEIKLGQVRVLLEKADGVSKLWDDAPIVICGDFNSTPKSPLYNYIAEERLDLSEVPRDKVSGQESATINTVKRNSLNASARHQDAVKSSQSSAVASEREVKDNKMTLDEQKLDSPEKDSRTGSCACTLSQQPQSSVVYEPGSSCMVISCSESMNDLPGETHVEGAIHEASSLESCQEDSYEDSENVSNNANPNATSSSSQIFFEEEECSSTDSNRKKVGQSKVGDFGSENVASIHTPTVAHCSDVSSTGQFSDSSNVHEVSLLESSESVLSVGKETSPKTSHELKNSYTESCFDVLLDEKMDNLSLNVVSEGTKEDELLGENREVFLSQLHGEASSLPSDSNQFQTTAFEGLDESLKKYDGSLMLHPLSDRIADDAPDLDSEVVDGEKLTYDPSAWTPMDIETATGNADCTVMEHNLKLTSAYREVELQDFSGTRDSTGEPEVTSYHRLFMGTVDYIWRSEGLQTARVLAPIPKNAMKFVRGFPTKKWGSDHIALVSEFAFTNGISAHDTSVQKQ